MTTSPSPGAERPARHDVPRAGRSGFAVVNGRQVHYLEWGHAPKPAVVCLHGGGQTAYMYEELGASLGDRYHVLAWDLPDHGDSDPIDATFSDRLQLAATLPPTLAQFGVERAVLVGGSLGGITVATAAAAYDGLAAGVVLIDVGHRLEPVGVERIIKFMSEPESFASLDEAAAAIAAYSQNRRRVDTSRLTRNLRQRADGRWVWKHGMGRRIRDLGMEHLDLERARSLEGFEDDLRAVPCPVLVLRGSVSDVLSDQAAEELLTVIPQARLARISGAGHLAAGDNPASFVGLVQGFLDELGW